MTCGSEIGNAARYNQALCRKKGLRHRGTLPVVMPENYIALFDAPEEAEARKIIAAAQPALERGIGVSAHNFRKKRAFFVKGATVATKCINKSRTILKRSSGSSLLVLA